MRVVLQRVSSASVTVDGEMLYSKAETGRHADPGEVLRLFVEKYGQGVTTYGSS